MKNKNDQEKIDGVVGKNTHSNEVLGVSKGKYELISKEMIRLFKGAQGEMRCLNTRCEGILRLLGKIEGDKRCH